ncbi:MAG TPA: FAD-dependent monooxygenase [Chthoniobacterales bacterium]
MDDAPVLIVGGGPVGLSLALGLARHNVRSILFEAKSEGDPHSRALGILPRSLEIFRGWGIYDRFVNEGLLLSRVDVWAAGRTSPVATLDLTVLSRLSSAPGVLVLPQDVTEALLLEAVKATGLTEVLPGCRAHEMAEDASGAWARVTDRDGVARTYRGQYLVGCDGAHSTVRKSLGWELEGKTYRSRVLLVDVRIRDERDRLPWPRLAQRRRGVLASVRYKAEHWRLVSILNKDESDEMALTTFAIGQRVAALFGAGSYEQLWASVFQIHCRTSPHLRRGRLLLAGDAGHINSPAGGQGMNSGIQDAHNLAWKLARALAGADAEALLSSYEAERREAIVNGVARYTDFLTRVGLLAPGPVRSAFGTVVRMAPRLGLLRRLAPRIGMLDTVYSRSAILSGEGRWVGRRAPDGDLIAPDGSHVRLLDLAGPHPVLLLFTDGSLPGWNAAQVAELFPDVRDLKIAVLSPPCAPADAGTYRIGPDGVLWKAWSVTGDTAALIRPDGHIGWMGRRPRPAQLAAGVRQALGSWPLAGEEGVGVSA